MTSSEKDRADSAKIGIAKRIRELEKRFANRQQAADIAGVAKSSLQRWVNGESDPSFIAMARLAKKAGVSMDWVAFGDTSAADQTEPTADQSMPPNFSTVSRTVPIVGLADCGLGAWCTTSEMRVNANAPDDLLDPDAFAVLTTGNSMLPAGIPPGILCFCSPNTRITAGDAVYVQRYDNTASIKIFQKRDDKWYYLLGYGSPDAEGAQKIFTERLALNAAKRIAPVIWEKRKL